MNIPNTKAMVKQLGTSIRGGLDPDGDKHISMIDCKPHDKSRQDVTVTVGGKETRVSKWWKRKKTQMAEQRAERKGYRKAERAESRKAEHEERMKYAREKEKIKTETALKAYKRRRESGGVVGQFVGGFKKSTTRRATYATTKKGKKKGKRTRRVVTRTAAPPPRKSLSEHMAQYKF